MKNIISAILSVILSFSSIIVYAEINFDVEKVKWLNKYIYDTKNNIAYSQGYEYDWSKDEDIPTIDAMPEPDIIVMNTGYITRVNGEYYWVGRWSNNIPLPTIPLGNAIPENIEQYTYNNDKPDLFPYNAYNKNIKYEVSSFDIEDNRSLKYYYGDIGKWTFGWNGQDETYIFVDGINSIKTNLTFNVRGSINNYTQGDFDIMYWEDDEKFYIKNYNILISTDKESFYEAMEEIEAAPKVKYRDTYLSFEQVPIVQNDRTLIPIRFLFEQMGAEVDWNDETQTATVSQNNTAIAFAINEADADINGQTVTMDVPAQLINGKTMVPVRFLSENLGYTVEWDGENRIITIE